MKRYKHIYYIYAKKQNTVSPGVDKKVASQVQALQNLLPDFSVTIHTFNKSYNLFTLKKQFSLFLAQHQPAIFIIRDFGIHFLPLLPLLKKASMHSSIIIDFPTLPKTVYHEHRLHASFIQKTLSFLFFNTIYKQISSLSSAFISYSHDSEPFLEKSHKKVFITQNAAESNLFTYNDTPSFSNHLTGEIHLFALALLSPWHGYDRLIHGLTQYNRQNEIKVFFHIYGEGSDKSRLEALTHALSLNDTVFFHGFASSESLRHIHISHHIAIGSLGMHRINALSATPLKLREYCARGIPFIYAHSDPDFDDKTFALRIPADESPVDIESIISFYNTLSRTDYRTEMRDYAQRNLTWEHKLKEVAEYIKNSALEQY